MSFVKIPNLPENKVNTVLAGELIEPYIDELSRLGVNTLKTRPNQRFSTSLKFHADLFVNYLGNGRILLDSSCVDIIPDLTAEGIDVAVINEKVNSEYPFDCILNSVITDSFFLGKYDISSQLIKDYIAEKQLKIIDIPQGYAKCSVVSVTENAFITDDISAYNAIKSNNSDVLLVEKGSITLKNYDYGFIGGCCGKLDKNTIAFCGDIIKHKSFDNIKAFCDNYKVDLLSLGNGELTDIGSIIPITENGR